MSRAICLRVTFKESHGPYLARDRYVVELPEARELRALGVLQDRVEVCEPQMATVTAKERAEIEALFAPPPPPPTEEPVAEPELPVPQVDPIAPGAEQ